MPRERYQTARDVAGRLKVAARMNHFAPLEPGGCHIMPTGLTQPPNVGAMLPARR